MTDRHPFSVLRSVTPADAFRHLCGFAAIGLIALALMLGGA